MINVLFNKFNIINKYFLGGFEVLKHVTNFVKIIIYIFQTIRICEYHSL